MLAVHLGLLLPAALVALLIRFDAIDSELLPRFFSTALLTFFASFLLSLAAARWGKSRADIDSNAIGKWSGVGAVIGAPAVVLLANWLEISESQIFQFGIGSLCGITLSLSLFLGLIQLKLVELRW